MATCALVCGRHASAATIVALALLMAVPVSAQVEFTFVQGRSNAATSATRFADLDPDLCNHPNPPDPDHPPLSFSSACSSSRSGELGGSATASADGSWSVSLMITGTAPNGKPLVSELTATALANASTNATSVNGDPPNRMLADGGADVGGTFQFKAPPGTHVTIALNVSGDPPVSADGCFVNPPAGERTLPNGGFLTVGFGCISGGNFILAVDGNGAKATGRGATLTVRFSSDEATGACCAGGDCGEITEAACDAAGGDYRGDSTSCDDGCGDVVTWVNAAGGDYGEEDNWEPPRVPVSTAEQDDTAVFDLGATYGVNVAGSRAKRFVIRNGSLDLVGGTAEVTSSAPSEPSLVVGQGGKLHLVSGTFTSVDSVLGDVSGGGLAEVDLISSEPHWNNTGRLTIGDAGPGRLTVVSGQVTSAESRIGGGMLGPGEAIVGGPGWWTTGNIGFGFGGGPGTLEVKDGGVVLSEGGVIGLAFGTGNVATITGTMPGNATLPSIWTLTGNLQVAKQGAGLLEVLAGGQVGCNNLRIGNDSQGVGTVRVKGSVPDPGANRASTIETALLLDVGGAGVGELFVQDGGVVKTQSTGIGIDAPGTVVIEGGRPIANDPELVPSLLLSQLDATLGLNAAGVVRVRNGGQFSTPFLIVGSKVSSLMELDDALLTTSDLIRIGGTGSGTMTAAGGTTVLAGAIDLGADPTGAGRLLLTGRRPGPTGQPTSALANGPVRIAVLGSGELVVRDGAELIIKEGQRLEVNANGGAATPGRGVVRIEGVNVEPSEIEARDDVRIGGRGKMEVLDGGLLEVAGAALLGGGGAGVLDVKGVNTSSGDPSTLSVAGNVVVGTNIDGGDSVLSITDGARGFVAGTLFVGSLGPDDFAIIDGAAGATRSTLVVNGPINVSEESLLSITSGAQVFSDSAVVGAGSFGTAAVGATRDVPSWVVTHTLDVGMADGTTGELALCPDGLVTVGELFTIFAGSTLKGAGRVVAPQTVNHGTILPGCSPGTFTIDGEYVQTATGTLRIEIGGSAAGLHDVLEVTGNATLAGTLELAFVAGYVPRAGDALDFLHVLGTVIGDFAAVQAQGLPPGWKAELQRAGNVFGFTIQGDYLCYATAAARGAKFPKGLPGMLDTAGGPVAFGLTKPTLLCRPSGPSTGSQQGDDTQLRGYAVAKPTADPLGIGTRALRVTNGLHPAGELIVDTAAASLVLAPAAQCLDVPAGVCPADLAAPAPGAVGAFLCAPAKRAKTSAPFPKGLTASAIDAFGEPRTYKLAKPTRVCAPASRDLAAALACYAAKPVAKSCAPASPLNAAGPCKSELDCGGTKKVTTFCGKSTKHAKRGPFVLATMLTRERAGTTKPTELCLPATLTAP